MTVRADAVVVGAGVTGCAVAYHLALAGFRPLVLERRGIAQAASCRAAGLLTRARSQPGLAPLVRQTYADLEQLEAEAGQPLGVHRTGSLYIGVSEPAKRAHRELLAAAGAQGETVRRLTAGEAMARVPWLRLDGGEEVFSMPQDAYADGYSLACGYARAARDRGVQILEGQGVEQVLREGDRVTGVVTAQGRIDAPVVVDAAGAWANLLASWVLGAIPMAPVRSHYWITGPDPRFQGPQPFLVLPDARAYARPESGGLLVGFRETRSVYADPRDLPEDLQGHRVAGDGDGWASLEEGAPAFQRFLPGFAELPIAHYLSGYSTYVPDGRLAVGPLPGIQGFFSGAGCCGGGVAMAGGIGRALAQLIVCGASEFDLKPHDPGRFGPIDPFSPPWGRRCASARSGKTSG